MTYESKLHLDGKPKYKRMKAGMKPSESIVSIPEPENERVGWSIFLCFFLVLLAICVVALFSMLCEDLHNRQRVEKMTSHPLDLSAVELRRTNSTIVDVRGRIITKTGDKGHNKMTKREKTYCRGCCRNPRCWSKYAGICAKCLNINAETSLNSRDGHTR